MKRLVLTLTLALSLISFSSFAKDDVVVSPAALQSFKNAFKTATEVNWTAGENFFKADFSMNGQYVSAFYNAEGYMIALTRNISSLQLPITLQASLKNNFDQYWISELFEVANEEGTAYYITLENADTKMVMKSSAGTDWSTYKKVRKS
ncbi:MAG: hypothetical protein ACXWV0_01360 [Flavisolibacter sp.]